jgi:hypothetical protein
MPVVSHRGRSTMAQNHRIQVDSIAPWASWRIDWFLAINPTGRGI